MRRLGSAFLSVSLLAGCGGTALESSSGLLSQQAPLIQTDDVDVAPECTGILTFANTATFQTLDVYLPSNVANNLISRRQVSPFVSLADIASVHLVGPVRLDQLEDGARHEGFVEPHCVGILDNLALSSSEATALVALVNTVSDSELHDILPNAWNGAVNLLGRRPFASVQDIAQVDGISSVGFRNLRNAATLSRPLEALIAAVNAVPDNGSNGVSMARHFDWWQSMKGGSHWRQLECFGLEPNSVPRDAVVRPSLADADEVRAEVEATVASAQEKGVIPEAVRTAGLENLEARIAGRSFKGCRFTYANDPWSQHTRTFFVDTANGFSVMTTSYWAE
jgi:DNA uptake protein ComE-like DNA-binding protein